MATTRQSQLLGRPFFLGVMRRTEGQTHTQAATLAHVTIAPTSPSF